MTLLPSRVQAMCHQSQSRGVARHPDPRVELKLATAEYGTTELRPVSAGDDRVCAGCIRFEGAEAAIGDVVTSARARPPTGCLGSCRCRVVAVLPPAVQAWTRLSLGGCTLASTRELLALADVELGEEYSTPEEARARVARSKNLERRRRPVIKALRGDAAGALGATKRRRKRDQCHRPGAPAAARCATCRALQLAEKQEIEREVAPRRALVHELKDWLRGQADVRDRAKPWTEANRQAANGRPEWVPPCS